jgi:hypothetical protein
VCELIKFIGFIELIELIGFIGFTEFVEFKGSAQDKGIESGCQEQEGVQADCQIFCLTARHG